MFLDLTHYKKSFAFEICHSMMPFQDGVLNDTRLKAITIYERFAFDDSSSFFAFGG